MSTASGPATFDLSEFDGFADSATQTAEPAAARDTKKQINQLWKWYRNNNMQQVSHIGDEATDNPWKQLHGIKKKKDLAEDPELLNHLAALHDQYLNGFDGPAKRQRTV